MNLLLPTLVVLASYLLGSLSFAVIFSRLMGLSDPRSYGSKNPGATNVLRSGNKAAAALTLFLDALKGWLPVWCLSHGGAELGLGDAVLAPVALAAFVGHVFPVFFRFQGGKGVATAAGVLATRTLSSPFLRSMRPAGSFVGQIKASRSCAWSAASMSASRQRAISACASCTPGATPSSQMISIDDPA